MSGTKKLKPLVITTKAAHAAGSEYVWNKLQNPDVFIRDIETQEVNTDNSEELNKLISGIPTPFARATMFKYAINYVGADVGELAGLMAFYKTLQDEWKGLVACLALDNQPITVEKIPLEYTDGGNAAKTENIYEPKGGLGTMLFEDRPLWSDQTAQMDRTKRAAPFIYVIRYQGVVVGGAAPESLLFTAPVYAINTTKSFYDQKTKRFTDPLKGNLTREEVEKLYVYVRHVERSLNAFRESFTLRKPEMRRVSTFLERWINDIKSYATKKGYEIDANAIVPNLNKFQAPFDKLFNFQTTLYGFGGRISSDRTALQLPDGVAPVEVELAELLLNPELATVAEIIFDDPVDDASLGVHLLKVQSDSGERYFTLPFSEKGLAIFQDNLDGVLRTDGEIKSYLSGIYDMAARSLQITLQVDVNGNSTSFAKTFKEPIRIDGQKAMCWPDFVSTIWTKYYMYSELPHNAPEVRAFPLRADRNDFRLITDAKQGRFGFKRIAMNGKKIANDDNADLLVEYDINKLGTTDLKYEIYESEDPFKGLEIEIKGKSAGYVLFKRPSEQGGLRDYRKLRVDLTEVRVGFDFGSNNTCISHAKAGEEPSLLTFKNRRRFLLGVDVPASSRSAAAPHEVFFFQNEPTESNQVKSMVMIHDERRVRDIEKDPKNALKREIKGGFPVFEKNIPVEDSTQSTLTARFANQPSYIKYDMKWSSDDKENAYKQGLLKALWLKTYAELLDQERYPEALVWAYPSAMNKQTLLKYAILWNEVGQLNPLRANASTGKEYVAARVAPYEGAKGQSFARAAGFGGSGASRQFGAKPAARGNEFKALTEAAAVCRHALLGAHLEATNDGLLIGLDVGGSTTDILCVVVRKDASSPDVDDFKETLVKESSIKFAAGRLAEATTKSRRFQEVLISYCRKKDLVIHGITVPPQRLNANTSAYYFNLIIDLLKSESDLNEFYRNLAADCPELFIVNSFMTGLIMFYAGQQAAKIRQTQEENRGDYLTPFCRVMIGCFGKGGRMFDWLRAVNEEAAYAYYQECFAAGYGPKAYDHIQFFHIQPSDPKYVKAEVSFGLAGTKEINIAGDQENELVGEEGFTYNGAYVDPMTPVEGRFLQHFGNQFAAPKEYKRFGEFAAIFYGFCKEYFGLDAPSGATEINNMRLKAYVDNIPEYRLAKSAQEFDFDAPIIVLEGMCFLDTVLMPQLFR